MSGRGRVARDRAASAGIAEDRKGLGLNGVAGIERVRPLGTAALSERGVTARRKPNARDREGGHVSEMQRRRLLLAFVEVLAECGLEDASIGRVCARARVSRRTFYDLFCDREACFLAVVNSAVERISQGVLSAYAEEDRTLKRTAPEAHTRRTHGKQASWRKRVRGALAALLELLDEDPALARVLLVETLKAGPVVLERRRRVFDELAATVEEGRVESKQGAGPPPLTGQSTVGGVISVLHARLLENDPTSLSELLNPLMSMIVHPYLGPAAARRELNRPIPLAKPARDARAPKPAHDPFKDLPIRITFRTARVLAAIGAQPGASNRQIADAAGVTDQGQMSKLLNRLQGLGLIENYGHGQAKGEPNAWTLTQRGEAVHAAIAVPRSSRT